MRLISRPQKIACRSFLSTFPVPFELTFQVRDTHAICLTDYSPSLTVSVSGLVFRVFG